jgi:cyanophycinase
MHHFDNRHADAPAMQRSPDNTQRRRLLTALAAGAATPFMSADLRAAEATRPTDAPPDPRGACVAIGGALRFDNDAVWARLAALAGGRRSTWVVSGLASTHAARSAAQVVEVLRRHGARAEAIEVAPGSGANASAADPRLVARVQSATGVFFCGGAQERIVDTLMPGGHETPLLAAIRAVRERGGVIAGTSAGAAVMSTTMFRDAQEVLAVLKGHLCEGREIDRGLGFVGPRLFVDQHFLRRGRIGRMLPMMVARGYTLGLGVDENSAAILRGDDIEVIGAKGALLVDLAGATHEPQGGAFALQGARISYLDRGDRYDLATRRFTPSAQKRADHVIDPNAAGFEPYHAHARYWSDMLGDTTIANAMCELIDSGDREAFGLAADLRPPADDPRPDLAFEFRLHKGDDSLGWFTGSFGGEDYSVSNLYLDVAPVRLARPAHRPWTA